MKKKKTIDHQKQILPTPKDPMPEKDRDREQ